MRGFNLASVIVLVVVVAVIGTAAVLLARTVGEAQSINDKAQNIATTGKGINTATDSVVQLNRTNKLATSILKSATPLDRQLGGIVGTAQGIDALAGSINATAGSINSTAGTINSSAGKINSSAGSINSAATDINGSAGSINSEAGAINSSANKINSTAGAINGSAGDIDASAGNINTSARRINTSAGSILNTAKQIDQDVRLINTNLNVTLSLVTAVKGDTGNILGQAGGANDTAACISKKLFGSTANDGDCQAQPTPASRQRSRGKAPKLQSPADLEKALPAPKEIPAAPTPEAPKDTQTAPKPVDPTKPLLDQTKPLLDGILKGLPVLDQALPKGQPTGDLLRQLLPGLGQR